MSCLIELISSEISLAELEATHIESEPGGSRGGPSDVSQRDQDDAIEVIHRRQDGACRQAP